MDTKKAKEKKVVELQPKELKNEPAHKDVAMTESKPQTASDKYSYEELEKIAVGLSEQAEKMRIRLMQYEELLNSKRLDYLFAVLQNREGFSETFITRVIAEIEDSLMLKDSAE